MISYPFTSKITYDPQGNPIYDRAVDSAMLRQLDRQDYTDGVCINPSTCCQVVADTGMQVKVLAGMGRMQGVKFIETADRVLQIQASNTLDRIDTVVSRKDDSDQKRGTDYYIIEGIPSATPIPPTLTRNASVWELGLANLFIAKNTSSIPQDRITDTRQDNTRCGYSIPIQAVDTTSLYQQYEDAMTTILQGYQNAIDGTLAGQVIINKNNIGTMSSLKTAIKTSLVNAINELVDNPYQIIEQNSISVAGNIWKYTKYKNGDLDMRATVLPITGWTVGTAYGTGQYLHTTVDYIPFPFAIYDADIKGIPKGDKIGVHGGNLIAPLDAATNFKPYIINTVSTALTPQQVGEWNYTIKGRWKA